MVRTMKLVHIITLGTLALAACTPKPGASLLQASPTAAVTQPPVAAPTVSREPAPVLSSIEMFEGGGWGWNADNDQLLYRSTDAGLTWQQVALPGPDLHFGFWNSAYLDLQTAWLEEFNPPEGGQVFWHTQDGGQTWTRLVPSGLDELDGSLSLHFSDALHGWAETAGAGAGNLYLRLYQTDDGGASYQVIPIQPPNPEEGLPSGTVHLCNMCADTMYYDPSCIVIVQGDMGSMQPGGALRMQVSMDLGAHWQQLNLPLPPDDRAALVSPLEASFVSASDGFQPILLEQFTADGFVASMTLAVYASHDGGQTWELRPGLLPDLPQSPPALQFIDSQDAVVICGSAICTTHDAATTWQSFPLDPAMAPTDSRSILDLDFVSPSTGWIVTGDFTGSTPLYRLFRTEDGGRTWTPQ